MPQGVSCASILDHAEPKLMGSWSVAAAISVRVRRPSMAAIKRPAEGASSIEPFSPSDPSATFFYGK